MKFSIKDFFSQCDQICSFSRIWSHLLKKSVMENFIFCAVNIQFNIFEPQGLYWTNVSAFGLTMALKIIGCELQVWLPKVPKFLFLFRSSYRRCSVKKGVPRSFTKFSGKHLCQSHFFNNVAGLRPELYLKRDYGTGVSL